jgi:hypothetical protein
VQQLPSEGIPQSSTPLDDTVTETSLAAGGGDAPANAPQPISAASVKAVQQGLAEIGDSLDSLKAGQMELVRLIEHNRRPAAAYETYISAQLGAPLYSRLQEKTQRALQLSEYFYNINQEPDGFSLTALTMAQGYENELLLRVVWPFVNELQAAHTETYDAQGKSKDRPLILKGEFSKTSVTLGNLGWYLKNDPIMQSRVSVLGLDVKMISKDVALISRLRNRPAHDFNCDRAVADDLRRLILCSDGVLSRLHPTVVESPGALTA